MSKDKERQDPSSAQPQDRGELILGMLWAELERLRKLMHQHSGKASLSPSLPFFLLS